MGEKSLVTPSIMSLLSTTAIRLCEAPIRVGEGKKGRKKERRKERKKERKKGARRNLLSPQLIECRPLLTTASGVSVLSRHLRRGGTAMKDYNTASVCCTALGDQFLLFQQKGNK